MLYVPSFSQDVFSVTVIFMEGRNPLIHKNGMFRSDTWIGYRSRYWGRKMDLVSVKMVPIHTPIHRGLSPGRTHVHVSNDESYGMAAPTVLLVGATMSRDARQKLKGGNRSTRRKPTQARGEHANSTQEG
ncbi:uncharacterized protein LOC144049998 [Vanacampus margaritifer]